MYDSKVVDSFIGYRTVCNKYRFNLNLYELFHVECADDRRSIKRRHVLTKLRKFDDQKGEAKSLEGLGSQ